MCTHCYKLASDEARHKILRMLKGKSLSVNEVTDKLHVKQPTASHHLTLLAKAGLLRVEKQGRTRRYSLATDSECFSECGLLAGLK